MESSTRNYLIRLLEDHKDYVKSHVENKLVKDYEQNQIAIACARLLGKEPVIALNRNQDETNYVLSGVNNDE